MHPEDFNLRKKYLRDNYRRSSLNFGSPRSKQNSELSERPCLVENNGSGYTGVLWDLYNLQKEQTRQSETLRITQSVSHPN